MAATIAVVGVAAIVEIEVPPRVAVLVLLHRLAAQLGGSHPHEVGGVERLARGVPQQVLEAEALVTAKQYLAAIDLIESIFRIKEIPYKRMDLNNLPFPRGVNDILDVTLENVVAYLVRSGFDVVDEDLSVTVDGGTVTIAATESSLLYCGSFTVGAVAY